MSRTSFKTEEHEFNPDEETIKANIQDWITIHVKTLRKAEARKFEKLSVAQKVDYIVSKMLRGSAFTTLGWITQTGEDYYRAQRNYYVKLTTEIVS